MSYMYVYTRVHKYTCICEGLRERERELVRIEDQQLGSCRTVCEAHTHCRLFFDNSLQAVETVVEIDTKLSITILDVYCFYMSCCSPSRLLQYAALFMFEVVSCCSSSWPLKPWKVKK